LREAKIRAVCLFRRNFGSEAEVALLTRELREVLGPRALIALDFGQKFFDRPVLGTYLCPAGYNGGPPYPYSCELCAAGVGYLVPYVSTSEPERVEALVSWETTNARLGLLQRSDLFDGAYVSSVVNRVAAKMGGWKQE